MGERRVCSNNLEAEHHDAAQLPRASGVIMAYRAIPAVPGHEIYTLANDGTDLDITGLAGDQDGDYEFWGTVTVAANASNTLTLQPNQLATNQVGQLLLSAGAAASGASAGGVMFVGAGSAAGSDTIIKFHGWLTSKSGRSRFFQCNSRYNNGAGTQINVWCWTDWTDTTTVINNLRFNSTQGLKAGSFVRLSRCGNTT